MNIQHKSPYYIITQVKDITYRNNKLILNYEECFIRVANSSIVKSDSTAIKPISSKGDILRFLNWANSLENLLKNRKLSEERKAYILNDLSYEYVEIEPRIAQGYARKALQIAIGIGNKALIAKSYQYIGTALYTNLDNSNKMYEYTRKALDKHRAIGNKMGIAACQTNLRDSLQPHRSDFT